MVCEDKAFISTDIQGNSLQERCQELTNRISALSSCHENVKRESTIPFSVEFFDKFIKAIDPKFSGIEGFKQIYNTKCVGF